MLRSFRDLFLGSELASMLYVDEVLDGGGRLQYIDRVVSMSAVETEAEPVWVDQVIEEQILRFEEVLSGS